MDRQSESCCMICGEMKSEGIVVVHQFICSSCEQEIVRTDVKDAKYPIFIDRMRKLWMQLQA
ncbi:sigma factor G inhibitor Gin [Paenibacillus sp. SC116]|uniref:sigma factor G inhibitor Gin n=1 Tax=Paenibacillus sp. SC116 TaxID=2968986 RepID=UPI00215B5AFE|nr:sigma factor G inhibitor Gin [Paenibacillus sp. SC116]MCR8846672.1 sigma factor G inhibitor Gin [Paenibacillus sp. SC116]